MKRLMFFCFTVLVINCFAQQEVAPHKYLLHFTDKNNSPYSIENPQQFLSQRAIDRRAKMNFAVSQSDLPVNSIYIDSLKKLGLLIVNQSKWFNSVVVCSTDSLLIDTISNLGFIVDKLPNKSNVKIIKSGVSRSSEKESVSKSEIIVEKRNLLYGSSANQIEMMNGHLLHNLGYQGQGITIAVIDAGFSYVNLIKGFDSLRVNNQLLGTRDFVDGDLYVYEGSTHGTKVLSTMACYIPDSLIGTAPKANYWLLRSEISESEYIVEEENWISAIEFADSVGVDVVNSSLGYTTFDDSTQNHRYSDLDGKTTRISRAATMSARRGMIVVTSAGNEGYDPWRYISAPADADSVLTVGSVDNTGKYAYFSSIGPAADGRVKPNVMAKGLSSTVIKENGLVGTGSGTSFSSPIMAGMVACYWQSHPELTNIQIIDAIQKSSNHFHNPDSLYGYGIPDFGLAFINPKGSIQTQISDNELFDACPNPFSDHIYVELKEQIPSYASIQLTDLCGKIIFSDTIRNTKSISINKLQNVQAGVYLLQIKTNNGRKIMKMIKQ